MEEHELDLLEDLFEFINIDGPNAVQMYQLYGVFVKDMIKNPILIDKKIVGYNKQISKHPLFRGKPEGFEHICTRESKHSGRRNFDPERTNKIHWIKPIINFKQDNRIKYFERLHFNGQNQRYFWYSDKSYVVIVREITNSLQLVTAFKVDKIEQIRYKKWYEEFKFG